MTMKLLRTDIPQGVSRFPKCSIQQKIKNLQLNNDREKKTGGKINRSNDLVDRSLFSNFFNFFLPF